MNELYEKLRNADEQEFIESLKFGLIALDEGGNVLHFCGYANEPTNEDRENLCNELKTDDSFGLTERDNLVVVEAPQEIIDHYKQRLQEAGS